MGVKFYRMNEDWWRTQWIIVFLSSLRLCWLDTRQRGSFSEHVLHGGREAGLPPQSVGNVGGEDHGVSIGGYFGFEVIALPLL